MEIIYVIIGIIAFLGIIIIPKYNGIIKLRNVRKQSFADIDVQLKQRFNLIPNLMNTVKGYMNHEKGTLESVTKARTDFLNAGNSIEGKMEADNMLSGALKSIFAVAESYPDLKASQNFSDLKNELTDIENKIAAARRFFNNSTQEYNTYIEMFPNNIIALIFSFKVEKLYEIENSEERKNVKVEF